MKVGSLGHPYGMDIWLSETLNVLAVKVILSFIGVSHIYINITPGLHMHYAVPHIVSKFWLYEEGVIY